MNLKKIVKDFWWVLTAYKTFDEFPDSIVILNFEGEVVRFNQKARELFLLSDVDDAPVVGFETIIKDGLALVKDSVLSAKPMLGTATVSGRDFYVELNAKKYGSGYCVNLRDMTKLTNEIFNEDKILKFNNEKNAMLYKLENDIKSPLSSISGFSQGLLDGLGGELSEKQSKYIKIIHSNAEEMHKFMDKFLEFSYAESSIYDADFHIFDIVEAFKEVINEFDGEIEHKNINFDFSYDNIEKRNVFTDSTAIKKAFRNLLDIAITMTENGSVSVNLSHPDELTSEVYKLDYAKSKSYLQITIKDSGIGFMEDEMRYLCEPYAQLEKGKKNVLRAFMLGSASILVKRANGIINITSEKNKGSKYKVIIPIEKG
jgi:signal transduction histidine kinase